MTRPYISIIIAVFNGASTIKRCLDSALAQQGANFEVIVMDGGSTDGTVDLLCSYRDQRVVWVSEADHGIAHAWNKGIKRATGDWLLFLGADDYLLKSDVIGSMEGFLKTSNLNSLVVYGNVYAVSRGGRVGRLLSAPWDKIKFIYFGSYFSHQGVFHHKALFSKYGDMDERFKYGPDYEFLLRYLVDHDAVYVPHLTVSAMQMGGKSNCSENAFIALQDFALARRKHGIQHSNWLYYYARLKAYIKLNLNKVTSAVKGI